MKHKKHTSEEAEQMKNSEAEASEQLTKEGESPELSEDVVSKEVEELRKQSEENYNRLLRMQADFDNYKKRVAKEREDMYHTALETIVQQLLPVVDNMERAASAFRNDMLDEKYISGVEMVSKQMLEVLIRNGVKEIEALEKDFDPNMHHAVMQVPGED